MISPTRTFPSTILTDVIIPLYGSYSESNINALRGSSSFPVGDGIFVITLSNNSSIPSPVFPETLTISSSLNPILVNSSIHLFISALGKSILLIAGIIFKLLSRARYRFARVWACTPWVASTTNIAPSQAAIERDTS